MAFAPTPERDVPAPPETENGRHDLLRDRPKNLAQHIVDEIIGKMRDKTLQSGDKLPSETAMMHEYRVSRTVVREALTRLQISGLAETRHGVGTFITTAGEAYFSLSQYASPGNIRDIISIVEFRISLETEAAALAALRASPEHLAAMRDALDDFTRQVDQRSLAMEADKAFHMSIARATGNKYFEESFRHLGEIFPRARLFTARFAREQDTESFLRRVNREHTTIVDAIAGKDQESARAAMRVHLNSSRELLLKALESFEKTAAEQKGGA